MSQISIKPQFKNFQFSYPEITNPFDEKYRGFRASLTISYYLDSDNTIFFTLYSDDYSLKNLIEKVSDDWALTIDIIHQVKLARIVDTLRIN